MVSFQIEENENKGKIFFNGDIDIELTDTIEEIIEKLKSFKCVEINLSHVHFVDSTGIGLLIQLVDELRDCQITTELTNIKEEILEIFSLLQIPEILGKDVIKL